MSGSKPKSAMPVPKHRATVKVDRPAAALKRLRVSMDSLKAVPPITALLRQASGGLPQVVMAMRLCGDETTAAFLEKYDSIPAGDRVRVPFEAVAMAAKLDVKALLGSIMVALQAQAVNEVKILAMTGHKDITAARLRWGVKANGERDRTALDTAMGFLPSPKGPTFIGKAVFGSGKDVMDQQGSEDDRLSGDDDPDLDKLFPPANAMQIKLIPIRQRLPPE